MVFHTRVHPRVQNHPPAIPGWTFGYAVTLSK